MEVGGPSKLKNSDGLIKKSPARPKASILVVDDELGGGLGERLELLDFRHRVGFAKSVSADGMRIFYWSRQFGSRRRGSEELDGLVYGFPVVGRVLQFAMPEEAEQGHPGHGVFVVLHQVAITLLVVRPP